MIDCDKISYCEVQSIQAESILPFLMEKGHILYLGELTMDTKELKKVLAGIGVVGLLAGGGVAVPGSAGASG